MQSRLTRRSSSMLARPSPSIIGRGSNVVVVRRNRSLLASRASHLVSFLRSVQLYSRVIAKALTQRRECTRQRHRIVMQWTVLLHLPRLYGVRVRRKFQRREINILSEGFSRRTKARTNVSLKKKYRGENIYYVILEYIYRREKRFFKIRFERAGCR